MRPSGTEPKIKLYVSLSCDHFDVVAQKWMMLYLTLKYNKVEMYSLCNLDIEIELTWLVEFLGGTLDIGDYPF